MKPFQGIPTEAMKAFHSSYEANPLCHAMTNVLYKTNLKEASFRPSSLQNTQFQYSVDLPTLEVTDQMHSGRCWIFSALNLLREQVAKKCNLEKFELSQNYISFWDKFEKINYFLESVICLIDRPVDDRLLSFILSSGIADGGQWDMFVNIVEKYGVVPKAAMEETHQSSNTADMNHLINAKLRQYTAKLRAAAKEGKDLQNMKQNMLAEMYRFLCMCCGEPPKQFDFEYVDKDKKYHMVRGLTPKQFYQEFVGLNLGEDYISIINSPTQDKPFYQTFTVDYLGNVAEGRPVHYLNLPMDEVENLIVRQLQDGELVWFGSDVGHLGDRDKGLWCTECFDLSGTFGMDFSMTKADRLDYRESAMNHAMVITGVNLDESGKPTKWKIENSWSSKHGDKGYYQMSASWFHTFVYQAVIHKKYLSAKQMQALQTKPIHLNPWDPMGTLAD